MFRVPGTGPFPCLSHSKKRVNLPSNNPRSKPIEIQHRTSKEAVPFANLFVKPPFRRLCLKNLLPLLLNGRGGRFLTWSFSLFPIIRYAQKALLLASAILWSHYCQSEPAGGVTLAIARTNGNAIVFPGLTRPAASGSNLLPAWAPRTGSPRQERQFPTVAAGRLPRQPPGRPVSFV